MGIWIKKYCLICLGILITGIGSACCLKANVGVDAWDALGKSVSDIVQIKIGTVGMFLNIACFFGQIILLRKRFRKIQCLQIPVSILLGVVINVFVYDVLIFQLDSYMLRILLLIFGSGITAFGIACIMLIDEVTFALEGFCMVIANKLSKKFHIIRQSADVVVIILIVILTLITKNPWTIGVGTILGMLILGPMIGVFMKLLHPVLRNFGVIRRTN